ncbi:MAG: L-threonylcarbamoyladenylate synthase [Termitinemataceae bacterium]|nr:MAG: L-threonylcarbamoyladenylate synthase [Termitinemataceae bacterium]
MIFAPKTVIAAANDENIAKAAKLLKQGTLVAFPTETVYGLGADAFNSAALARVFEVKNRPHFDPLIIHIAALETLGALYDAARLKKGMENMVLRLVNSIWPGPLTLILPKKSAVPDIATAGFNTVAVRFPRHKVAQALIKQAGGAVAAPSANPFGRLSPTRADHVACYFGDKIELILDGGQCEVGIESTVLDLSGEAPCVLRQGGICCEELRRITGGMLIEVNKKNRASASPGNLPGHYAPLKPLFLFERGEAPECGEEDAVLFFSRNEHPKHGKNCFFLSETGIDTEAAACFFELFHKIDAGNWRRIYAEKASNTGLGAAINDRLKRASFPRI